MDGYAFCILPTENVATIGWHYIKNNRNRLKKFSFEESSIDLAVMSAPKVVIDGTCYKIVGQYFEKVSDTKTNRIIVLEPLLMKKENGDYADNTKDRSQYRYDGTDSNIKYAVIKEDDSEENNG